MSAVQPVRVSFGVLRANPRIVLFPVLGAVAMAVSSGFIAGPALVRGWTAPSPSASEVVRLVVGYLLSGAVFTFFSAAMICAVDDALRGEPVRIGTACRRALRHWRKLMAWSVLSSTVLLAIRQLERIPVVGWILQELSEAGWGVATYLALPAMMLDGLGVAEATRRSSRMVRETFSRQVFGSLWIALPMVLSVILGFVAFMLGVESNSAGPAVAGGVVAVVLLLSSLLVGVTVSGIFRTVLYRDASIAA